MKKTKIVVAGIGGVGGYFGGMLAKKYFNHDAVEIHFLARGNHLQEKSLKAKHRLSHIQQVQRMMLQRLVE
jgi:ketopantoate reductase